ncbi:tyrosine-type recombinase/integrase [Streptomyces calidiresistens]|uniref:Tyrosine-type recombinase/integrase n=1 Tax=Streptomyces calidiresistens TaxID=1485586 RepID=A0A7W3T4Y1_9ACTN|nr:site-specific integrase [Streptomyces calidiresistens]MBB0231030.1 tyrosine-type recombinase/integrase [Streptomyces calidiresistens]
MPPKRKRRRGFGRIRKLPSGRYQVRCPGPDGVLRPADRTFATVADADLWLARKRVEIEEGRWIDPQQGKATVEDWGARWLASVAPQLKAKTQASYRSLIRSRINPALGARELSALRPITVAEWVAQMKTAGLSASRIRQAYRVLSQMMASAVDNGMITASPCRGVRLPRMPQTEPHILTPEEASGIVRHAAPPHDVLIALLAFAGLRVGEAFALRRGDINVPGGLVLIDENLAEANGVLVFDTPKSHQKRAVTLAPSLVRRLVAHLDGLPEGDETLLFTNRFGRPLRYNQWRKAHFDPAVSAAGLKDVTPHDLRASHGSWVADRYGVMTAAHRLGHSNASVTTRHYARPIAGRDAEVAAASDSWLEGHDAPRRAQEGHDDDPRRDGVPPPSP